MIIINFSPIYVFPVLFHYYFWSHGYCLYISLIPTLVAMTCNYPFQGLFSCMHVIHKLDSTILVHFTLLYLPQTLSWEIVNNALCSWPMGPALRHTYLVAWALRCLIPWVSYFSNFSYMCVWGNVLVTCISSLSLLPIRLSNISFNILLKFIEEKIKT